MDFVDETEEQTERVRKRKTKRKRKTIGVCLAAGPILDAIGLFILPLSVRRMAGSRALGNGQWPYYNIVCRCVRL